MYPQNWQLAKGSLSTQSIKILTGSTVDKRFFGRPKWAFLGIGTTQILGEISNSRLCYCRTYFGVLHPQNPGHQEAPHFSATKRGHDSFRTRYYGILGFWIQIHTHRTNVWCIYLHLASKSAKCGYITHTWIRHGIIFSSIQPVVIKTGPTSYIPWSFKQDHLCFVPTYCQLVIGGIKRQIPRFFSQHLQVFHP